MFTGSCRMSKCSTVRQPGAQLRQGLQLQHAERNGPAALLLSTAMHCRGQLTQRGVCGGVNGAALT